MSTKHNRILQKLKVKSQKLKILTTGLLFLTFNLIPLTCIHGAFQDTGWGTRAGGMGNSFTAIANDPSAALWNPAGIAQVEMLETTFMYNKLFAGIEDVNLSQMYAAGVYPTGIGAFGLTITDFGLRGYYKENIIAASYSRDLADDLGLEFPIMTGLNLKYLTHSYILDDRTKDIDNPVFSGGTSAGGFTPDLGILVKPSVYSFGFSALNILQPDVGLKSEDKVPMILKLGTAYSAGDWSFFENITPTVDVSYRKPRDTAADLKVSGGVETWFFYNTCAARFGGNDREITLGFSYSKMFSETGLQLDYAYSIPLQLSDTSGSHRISLTFRYSLVAIVKAKVKNAQEEGLHLPYPATQKKEETAPAQKELSPERKAELKKGNFDAAVKHYEKGEYEIGRAHV